MFEVFLISLSNFNMSDINFAAQKCFFVLSIVEGLTIIVTCCLHYVNDLTKQEPINRNDTLFRKAYNVLISYNTIN